MSNKRHKAIERKANQKARMEPLHKQQAAQRDSGRAKRAALWNHETAKEAKVAA